MGKVIKQRCQSENWRRKAGLVLPLTLLMSLFLYEGCGNPSRADAAPLTNVSTGTLTSGWAHPSAGVAGPWTISNATFSCGAGSNRLLVAVVTGETGTAAAAAVTATKGTGNNFTTAVATASSRTQVWMGYLTESQIAAGGTSSIVITNGSGQPWTNSDVYLACYAGVDQATPIVTGGTFSAVGTTATTSGLSIAAMLDGVVISAISRGATTTTITPPTGYTEPYDLAGTGYSSGVSFKAITATGTETGTFTLSAADTRFAHAAISVKPVSVAGDTLTVGTNFPLATNASDSATGVAMQRLKLDSNANADSQAVLNGITLDDAGTATSIANVKIYIDTVAQSTLSASAVLIGNQALWNGASTTITLNQGTAANRTVIAGTSKYLYVVFDMASGQAGKTVQSHVTAVSVASPDTGATGLNFSSNSFTLTAGPVSTITSCNGCHGYPPVDGTARNIPAGQFQGSHSSHSNPCTVCHVDNGTNLKHADGNINMAANINNTGGAYSKGAAFAVNNAAFSGGTCSGITCHGQGAPTWGATSTAPVNGFPYFSAQCAKCHSGNLATDVTTANPFYSTAIPKVTANTDAKVGAHTSHLTTPDGLAAVLACADCHGTVALNTATHFNGATNFVWSTLATKGGTLTPTYTAATRVCANVYCHGASMPGGDTTGTNRIPTWNVAFLSVTLSRAACAACHGFPPPATAGHPAVTIPASWPAVGAATGALGTTCSCHANISTTGTTYANIFVNKAEHIDGTLQVSGGHAVPFYAHATPPFTSCTGCHNASAAGSYPAATAGAAPNCRGCHLAADPTVTSTGCTSCHGSPPNGTTHPNTVGSHVKHGTLAGATAACSICHNGAGAGSGAAHGPGNKGTNPAVDNIVFTAAQAGASATWTAATKTCTNTYCHGATLTGGTAKSPVWGTTLTGCGLCHGDPPATTTHSGVTVTQCINCHTHVNATGTGFTDATLHMNGQIDAAGGSCIGCHSKVITRTKGRPGTTLAAVTTEFGLAWGHRKTGRTAVTDADCIVCHLEGSFATGQPNPAFHQNGNIDLRDPDGAGETPITNMSNAAWTFQRFSTSYAAGSRTATGHTANTIDNVITQKFCMACHDSNGATNPTARSNNGGTGTASMPFGGIALGTTYTAANNAIGTQGLVDVKTQFATTNSSRHPVLGPRTRDFPYSTRLAVPYNNIGTARDANGTSGHATAASVVINCFDCHNTPTTPLTTRTVAAHGNAVTLRGTVYAVGAVSTLCTTCHTGYTGTGQHGTGSAWAVTGSSHNVSRNCQDCHGSYKTAAPVRPVRAQDYHGNNALVGGGLWPTVNSRPYAFIRAWSGSAYHRPYRATEFTTGSATCGAGTCPSGGSGGQVGDGSTRTYTPGGTY